MTTQKRENFPLQINPSGQAYEPGDLEMREPGYKARNKAVSVWVPDPPSEGEVWYGDEAQECLKTTS